MRKKIVQTMLLSICIASVAAGMGFKAAKKPEFNITDYGAVAGEEKLCTQAIQQALDACHAAGGGRVVVPEGTFMSGTVVMKDNVNLHVSAGAKLLGSNKIADYPPRAPMGTRFDSTVNRALVFARGAKNISITGTGILDGNGRYQENDFLDDPKRKRAHRPIIVWFDQCENILVRDVTFQASGFWTQLYSRSKKGHIDGIKVRDNVNDNNDGCDVVDSQDFIVENCDIDAIDDGICLKSFVAEGCKNIIIRNNRVKSLCNALKMGTESSGGFQDVYYENNHLYQVGRAGIALMIVDGGVLRNVVVKDTTMDVVATPIFIKIGAKQRPMVVDGEKVPPEGIGIVENIRISGVKATVDNETKPEKDVYTHDERRLYRGTWPKASSITGLPGHYVKEIEIEDVEIEILGGYKHDRNDRPERWMERKVPENETRYPNPDMFGILPSYAFYIRHVKDIELEDIKVVNRPEDPRPAIELDDVHGAEFEDLTMDSTMDTPVFEIKPNCSEIDTGK